MLLVRKIEQPLYWGIILRPETPFTYDTAHLLEIIACLNLHAKAKRNLLGAAYVNRRALFLFA